MKRIFGILLTIAILLSLCVTAFAANFSDVPEGAWYADAVTYVQENNLMSGTSTAEFSPNGTMTRSMLATVLYRAAGSPAVSGSDAFSDTAANAWYADGVLWASQQGFISGYGNGLFGTNDPVSREQIAAILWRYAGSPNAEAGADFADESDIASYAATAVDWARSNNIISGTDGNRFDPKGNATRAQVAVILRGYLTMNNDAAPSQPDTPSTSGGKILVAYFSASNNTKQVAGCIAGALNADTFEITPVQPYTSEDLNWTMPGSRVNREHDDPSLRNIALVRTTPDNWADYDTVFIGYPNWWGDMPMILYTFFDAYDFSGKTIVPFNTHGGSGFSGTVSTIRELEPNASVRNGLSISRDRIQDARQEIVAWVNGLDLSR